MLHLFPKHVGEKRGTELPLKWQSSTFLWFVRLHWKSFVQKQVCSNNKKRLLPLLKHPVWQRSAIDHLAGLRFITVTLRVLHIYPLGSLALPCALLDVPRSAGFQAAALQKHQHKLLLFCWGTKSFSLMLLWNSKSVPDCITWDTNECKATEVEAVESVS